jgi:hypothetical protein
MNKENISINIDDSNTMKVISGLLNKVENPKPLLKKPKFHSKYTCFSI